MLNLSLQSLEDPNAMIVRGLTSHKEHADKSFVSVLGLIDEQSLKMMLTYLKKFRLRYIRLRERRWPIYQNCLLLSILKMNDHQLTSKCLNIISRTLMILFNLKNDRSIRKRALKFTEQRTNNILRSIENLIKMTPSQQQDSLGSKIKEEEDEEQEEQEDNSLVQVRSQISINGRINNKDELSSVQSATKGIKSPELHQKKINKCGDNWHQFEVLSKQTIFISIKVHPEGNKAQQFEFSSLLLQISEDDLNTFLTYLNNNRQWFTSKLAISDHKNYTLFDDLMLICFLKINISIMNQHLLNQLINICGSLLGKHPSSLKSRIQRFSNILYRSLTIAVQLDLDIVLDWIYDRNRHHQRFQIALKDQHRQGYTVTFWFNACRFWWRKNCSTSKKSIIKSIFLLLDEGSLGEVCSMIMNPSQCSLSSEEEPQQRLSMLLKFDQVFTKNMIVFLQTNKGKYLNKRKNETGSNTKNEGGSKIQKICLYEDLLILCLYRLNFFFLTRQSQIYLQSLICSFLKIKKGQLVHRLRYLTYLSLDHLKLAMENSYNLQMFICLKETMLIWKDKNEMKLDGQPYFVINYGQKCYLCLLMMHERKGKSCIEGTQNEKNHLIQLSPQQQLCLHKIFKLDRKKKKIADYLKALNPENEELTVESKPQRNAEKQNSTQQVLTQQTLFQKESEQILISLPKIQTVKSKLVDFLLFPLGRKKLTLIYTK